MRKALLQFGATLMFIGAVMVLLSIGGMHTNNQLGNPTPSPMTLKVVQK